MVTVEKRKENTQKCASSGDSEAEKKKMPNKKYASSGDSEKRKSKKIQNKHAINYLIVLYEGSTPSRGKRYDGRCKVGK